MTTYEIIKQLCEMKGIAVTALEKELGFGRGSIGKLRNGGTSAERLQKIADYFGVTTYYLLNVEKNRHLKEYYVDEETAKIAQRIFETEGMRTLFDAAEDASPEDLKMAAELLRRLKKTNPDG